MGGLPNSAFNNLRACVLVQGFGSSHCGIISGLAMPYPAGIGYVAASIAGNFDLSLDYAVQLIQDKLQSLASNGSQAVQVQEPSSQLT